MAAKKLTTEEILAQARAQVSGGGSSPAAPENPPPAEPAAPPEAESETGGADAGSGSAAEPASTPSSTADILARARAQATKGGGSPVSKPAAAPKAAAPAAGGGGGATPSSTADILARARAQASGGGAAPAAAKPAGEKSAAPKKKAATPGETAERPSVEEMVRAVRGDATAAPATPATPAVPRLPARPPLPRRKEEAQTRRSFFSTVCGLLLSPFAAAWVMFSGATLAATLGLARFMMPNVLVEPPTRFKIGPPGDYPSGVVSTKWKAQFGIWVVRTVYEGQSIVYALSTVCTHLGCTPNWLEGEQKFKCPCHGSGFYITGINFEGPAPRPLERYGIRLAEDGMLEVDKSVKFQQELGQWEDSSSFVEVV